MGHLVFLVLHVVALLFGAVALVLTIPLHLIYSVLKSRNPAAAHDDGPHIRCPACRELVRADASKCKHCGTELHPTAEALAEARSADSPGKNIAIAIGALVLIGIMAKACGG